MKKKLSENICPWRNDDKYQVSADQHDHVSKRDWYVSAVYDNKGSPENVFNYRTLSQLACNYFHNQTTCEFLLQYFIISAICNSIDFIDYMLRGFYFAKILFYRTNCQKSNIFLMKIHIWIIVFIGDYEYCPGGPKFMLPRSNTKWNIEPPTFIFWEHSTFTCF